MLESTSTGIRPGHWQLPVRDLNAAIAFYQDALGMTVTQLFGDTAAFLSFDGYHHHVGLNTWSDPGEATIPATDRHFAFVYPSEQVWLRAVRRLLERGVPIESAEEHGTHRAVYLRDPDGYGVELYFDRPAAEWPRDAQGFVSMRREVLNAAQLLDGHGDPVLAAPNT